MLPVLLADRLGNPGIRHTLMRMPSPPPTPRAAPESPATQFSGAHLFDLFAIGKQSKSSPLAIPASVPDWDTEDDDRGCHVTIFAGPAAEQRARTYYEALQTKRLPTIRAGGPARRRIAHPDAIRASLKTSKASSTDNWMSGGSA
jgi:hypothetical protein